MTWEEVKKYCCEYYPLHEDPKMDALYREGEGCRPNGRTMTLNDGKEINDYYSPVVEWEYGIDTTKEGFPSYDSACFIWLQRDVDGEMKYYTDNYNCKDIDEKLIDRYMEKAGLEKKLTLF